MTDGTSQGLFIVVAIVIFGIFVVLAYILFEDTLSPAMASMFINATEKSDKGIKNTIQEQEFLKGFTKYFWEKGGISAVSGELLDTPHWKTKRIRQKDYLDVRNISELEVLFNDSEYSYTIVYLDKDGVFNSYRWYFNSGVVAIPEGMVAAKFMLGPADRNGSGNDSGISMDEFENVNFRVRVKNLSN